MLAGLCVGVPFCVLSLSFAGVSSAQQLARDFFDVTVIHERLAFKLYRNMGLTAPREALARVYINVEYFRFYSIVEHEDEDFLNRNLGEDSGALFEWKPIAFYNFEDLGNDVSPYALLLD